MSLETAAHILGLIGDAVTFGGAFLLAKREAGEGEREVEIQATGKAFKKYQKELSRVRIKIDETEVKNEGDIAIAIIGRSTKMARTGAGIIAIGFLFLFLARICELLAEHSLR